MVSKQEFEATYRAGGAQESHEEFKGTGDVEGTLRKNQEMFESFEDRI